METVRRISWEEFRGNGFLWWINGLLHLFGLAIVFDYNDDGTIKEVYPARVVFRGFNEETNTDGYKNLSRYMVENANELLEESKS